MRIFSYNILDGGEGRADPLIEVILAQNADVVALVEADDPAVLDRVARRTKMDVVHAPGNKGSVALLSRLAIGESIDFAPMRPGLTKSLLRATVFDPRGTPWHFGVVHLQARAGEEHEQVREREIGIVLAEFEGLRKAGTPHVLLGDFNANSPHQRIDLDKCKPSTREQAAANGGTIPRRVVGAIEAAGYVDTLRAARGEYADTHGTFTTQFPGQRVDYIFAHGFARERLKDAWIEYDRLATYASDHYPVGAQIE
ncbi:MAG: endonuclease/exonuclease/phosphatase family protein [Phycisphaerae bacterium]|nr:endonuclease/exonuclease/phosphatase family protein [Tepidisphaeraceae bacterium]